MIVLLLVWWLVKYWCPVHIVKLTLTDNLHRQIGVSSWAPVVSSIGHSFVVFCKMLVVGSVSWGETTVGSPWEVAM